MTDQVFVQGRVVQLSVSGGGVPKLPVPAARITEEGLEGDAHRSPSPLLVHASGRTDYSATATGPALAARFAGAALESLDDTLGVPVDPERVKASLNDGILTIRLAKAAEARSRKIAVTSGA